jgi:glutamate dehydrogenase (NADP+)
MAACFVRDMLAARGQSLDGRRVVVSGSGNVAIYAIDKAQQLGARVIACSDSTGYVVDEKGIDVDLLRQVKEQDRRCLDAYVEARPDATFVPGRSVWEVPCEIALPSATQNELTAEAAATMVRHGCVAVGEGANMPTTPEAVRLFLEAGVAFGPGKAANAGGVAASP